MVYLRYSAEALKQIRQSPLVKKPDDLPSIDQWLEASNEANNNNRRKTQPGRTDDSALPDGPLQRPLLGTRSRTGDDTILGPPRLSFTSTTRGQDRNAAFEEQDKDQNFGVESSERHNALRDRFFREREARQKDKGDGTTQRRSREEEGWSTARTRKTSNADDTGDRWQRLPDRDRERQNKERDAADPPLRRNGIGRGRSEQTWRDDGAEGDPSRQQPQRATGWRDRDQNREWGRGGRVDDRIEENPEWMTDDVDSRSTQVDAEAFERWRESMTKKKKITSPAAEDRQDPMIDARVQPDNPPAAKSFFTMDPDPTFGGLLGKTEAKARTPQVTTPATSKFLKMFAKEEAPAPVELPADPMLSSQEDKEGMQRILQLLGSKATPVAELPAPMEPETARRVPTSNAEHMDLLTNILARQGISRDSASAPPLRNAQGPAAPKSRFFPAAPPVQEAESSMPFEDRSPPRQSLPKQIDASPISLPPIISGQDRDNRQFLLQLMKGPTTRTPLQNFGEPPQQDPPNRLMEQFGRDFNGGDNMRQASPDFEQNKPRPAQHSRMHAPPGFALDENGIMNLQQRAGGNPMREQMPTNMGIPSQQMLPDWQKKGGPPIPHHLLAALTQKDNGNNAAANNNISLGMRAPPGFQGQQSMGNQRAPPNLGQMPMPGMPPHRMGMPNNGPGGPLPGMFGDGRGLPPPMPHGLPPQQFFGQGLPGLPPPGGPGGLPGFAPRGHGPDARELFLIQQQQQQQQNMGPGRQGPGMNHGPFNGFGPGQDEALRGGRAPPGFGGM